MASSSTSTEEATASTSTSQPENKEETKEKKEDEDDDSDKSGDEKMFECNICLDTAKDAVVSYCGHLFCWPCLYQWLETRPNRQSCPVCKAAISRDKCIPLYGRGGSGKDPRSKVPPRPPPTRTEQTDNGRFSWGSNEGNGGFHMSFGIGAFPFGFFASAFNFGGPGTTPAGANFMTPQQIEEQEFLSKVFIWVALIFIVWLMLA
ncbi:hypothetical protein Ocin01_04876 [Orchesella cincta]|uniref:RING-type E3 ubiquitin transferase n=1 Tax=Orchesella cincta TaxID=48709 RepID=A0A1D2N971_ORCCI|nr:hypothetical protein Ocin01_04876 [Orchesella cincta]